MLQTLRYLSVLIIVSNILGCYPLIKKEIKEPTQSLKTIRYFWPEFQDDMDIDSLALALERSLQYMNRLNPETVFTYGPDTYTVEHIRQSLETFLQIISQDYDIDHFNRELRERFLLYKVAGSHGSKKVLFTGYFEPILKGSLERDSVHRYPIYRKPHDLLKIVWGSSALD